MEHLKNALNGALDDNCKIVKAPPKKIPRVCPNQYQAEIPNLKRRISISNNQHDIIRKEVKRLTSEGFKAVFLRHKITQEDID